MWLNSCVAVILGRSWRWPPLRREHLRQNPKCVWCRKKATTVHHVNPVARFPEQELNPDNLASMCKRCHFVIGHMCNWNDYNKRFWETVEAGRAFI